MRPADAAGGAGGAPGAGTGGAGAVVRRRGGLAAVEIDGDGVIYDPVVERVHILNATGALVWRLIDGESSIETIASAIASTAGVELPVVLAGLLELVESLDRQGLLELT